MNSFDPTKPVDTRENELLFTNRFFREQILSIDPTSKNLVERRKKFKEYYTKRPEFQRESLMKIPKVIVGPPVIDQYQPNNLLVTNSISGIETSGQQALVNSEERIVITRRTLVNIDSRDRDQSIYPKPSKYSVYLNRKFINVKKIQIRTSEIPNSQQLIISTPASKQNNKILWKNKGNNTIFVATIPSGNYKPNDLETAFEEAMNKVKKDANNYHNFSITLDAVSDICTFSQLQSILLSNPFSTTEGSSTIYVNAPNHGFLTGDFVNISGAVTFAGINASLINKNQVVTVIDTDTYIFDITSIATVTTTGVGGNSCSFGIAQEFSLLFSEQGTPADILGFSKEDTAYSSIQQNTAVAEEIPITEIRHLDAIYSTCLLEYVPTFKELKSGDKVYLTNVEGTSGDTLVNDPAGYIITELTTTDMALFSSGFPYAGPGDYTGRIFKFPAAVDSPSSPTLGIGTSGTFQTRTINRPIKLAGENYILCKSKELANMANTGKVKDIACKIGLNSAPGTISFNTQISGPVQFDTPLPELETISFEFVNQNDEEIDFLDSDHAFVIEIQEAIQETAGVNFSSKLGSRDTT